MSLTRLLPAGLLAGFLFGALATPAPAQGDTQTAAAPADANVPQSVITELEQTFRPKQQPTNGEEAVAMQAAQMLEVMKFGEGLEAKYPKAPNLYEVQRRMLIAADFIVRYKPDAGAKARRQEISGRILASGAPAEAKVTPDYFVTIEKLIPAGGEVAKDAQQQIQAFLDRYAKTDAAAVALVRASQLAQKAKLSALETELLDKLEKDYSQDPQIQKYLKQKGRGTKYVGKRFQADLTLTDGKKLKLPDDLLGKVVVIDFWATWCPPCVRELPHMKKVYAQYKDKGVTFVGVSLDKPDQKQHLIDFVTKNEMPWPQSYSGKYWQDPTAKQYGVNAIPSIWVIGKDGNVVSDNAREDLEGTLDKALVEKADSR
jgi:thiol-disulfide isomerase/thioredoxin